MKSLSFKLFTRIEDRMVELNTVAICFRDQSDAQEFAEFAQFCSDKMRELGGDYSHEHLAGGQEPDVTIERLLDH